MQDQPISVNTPSFRSFVLGPQVNESVMLTTEKERSSMSNDEPQPLETSLAKHNDLPGLNSKLYGRDREERELLEAYHRCTAADGSEDFELVLLTGPSGTGKSALALQLRDQVTRDGGYFVAGKFDQLSKSEQYYPIVQAFTAHIGLVLEQDSVTIKSLQNAMKPIVNDDPLLLDVLPALRELLGTTDVTNIMETVKGPTIESRLLFAFCRFVRALCCPGKPLVLFLDDLQWADMASLKLVRALIDDYEIKGLMILGACRGNEVSLDHDLSVALRQMEDEMVRITNIQLYNLDPETITSMITEVLCIPSHRSMKLAQFIFSQTDGNVLFVRELLLALWGEGLLWKDSRTSQWTWESDDSVLDNIMCDNVIQLVTNRIKRELSCEVQNALCLASCLGAEFGDSVLKTLVGGSIQKLLALAETKRLVSYVGNGRWCFVHDLVQQSCYQLKHEQDIAALHLYIGRKLYKSLPPDELTMHSSLVIDQYERGIHLIENPEEKEELSLLCLAAAEKAAKASSFVTAARHLALGIQLLGRRHWRDNYCLCLDLYSAACEVEYCNGNFEKMDSFIESVLQNARTFTDKLRAYTTKIYSLGSRIMLQSAVKLGIDVLRGLGVDFPVVPRVWHVGLEIFAARRITRGISDEQMLCLPTMTDASKLTAMRIMNMVAVYALMQNSLYFPILASRMVQMSVRYGTSGMSAPAFALYAMLLCNILNCIEEGIRFANLSLNLVSKFQAREWEPRTKTLCAGFCMIWKESLLLQLPILREARKVAFRSGDVECALLSAGVYSRIALHVDVPLPQLVDEMRHFLSESTTYKQEANAQWLRSMMQLALNLLQESENPTILSGDVMDEAEFLVNAEKTTYKAMVTMIWLCKLMLCTYFGDPKLGIRLAKKLDRKGDTTTFSSLAFGDLYLHQGLAALAVPTKPNVRLARKKLRRLMPIAALNPLSFKNKVQLLEARILQARGQTEAAVKLFEESAQCAKKGRVLGETALAYELAAQALQRSERKKQALLYFQKALDAYKEWGAFAKAKQLELLREPGF